MNYNYFYFLNLLFINSELEDNCSEYCSDFDQKSGEN